MVNREALALLLPSALPKVESQGLFYPSCQILLLETRDKIWWENKNVKTHGGLTLSAPLGSRHFMQPINILTASFLELCKPGGLEFVFVCVFVKPCGFCVAVLLIVHILRLGVLFACLSKGHLLRSFSQSTLFFINTSNNLLISSA